jgi:hypothetical protein
MEMKQITLAALCVFSASSYAEDVPITGTVQSRCIIQTDTAGVYGNPNAYTLTTAPADGGVVPVVRFDVSLADAYKGRITYPTSFSASPSLNDTPVWSGSVNGGEKAFPGGTYRAVAQAECIAK